MRKVSRKLELNIYRIILPLCVGSGATFPRARCIQLIAATKILAKTGLSHAYRTGYGHLPEGYFSRHEYPRS
jgi:hypothetical protein